MGTKLLVIDNMTQQIEREAYSDKDLSKASLSEMFAEFDIIFDIDQHYLTKYLNCYVLREKEGYTSYKIEFKTNLLHEKT